MWRAAWPPAKINKSFQQERARHGRTRPSVSIVRFICFSDTSRGSEQRQRTQTRHLLPLTADPRLVWSFLSLHLEKLWSWRSLMHKSVQNISWVCAPAFRVTASVSVNKTCRCEENHVRLTCADTCFIAAEKRFRDVLWQTAAHFNSQIMFHVAEVV